MSFCSSFLFIAEYIPFYMPYFVYSPFDRHLGDFQFLAIKNKAVINILVQIFFKHLFYLFIFKIFVGKVGF